MWEKISAIKTKLEGVNIGQNKYAIDSGMVMELFGLREAKDIDLVFAFDTPLQNRIFDHTEDVKAHLDVETILNNPTSVFNFRGLNWMSIDVVRALKLSRREQKDDHDVRLIDRHFGTHSKTLYSKSHDLMHLLSFNAFKYRTRAYVLILKFLKITHLYQPIRRGYRAFKNRR